LDFRNYYSVLTNLENDKRFSKKLEKENLSKKTDSQLFAISDSNYDLGNDSAIGLTCTIDGRIEAVVMIDSGASTQFIDYDFCIEKDIKLHKKEVPGIVTMIDGRPNVSGTVDFEAIVDLSIDNHKETISFSVIKLTKYPLILGKSWLKRHNPAIDWPTNNVHFNSKYCILNCLPNTAMDDAVEGEVSTSIDAEFDCSAGSYCENTDQDILEHDSSELVDELTSYLFSVDRMVELSKQDEMFEDDDDTTLEIEELRKIIPEEFHDYLHVFSKGEADKLPPHRSWDHSITLSVPKEKLKHGPVYSLTPKELQFVKQWITEMVEKRFIEPSKAPFSSPLFVVAKPGGDMRPVVDYRALNDVTLKDVGSLPLINDSLRHIYTGKIFSKLDLRSAFNLIRVREGDEDLTTFSSRYGNFKFNVMPFGLCNAPATCQAFLSNILRPYLDEFCVCYVDDILVYSKTREEHVKHVKKIIEALEEAQLYLKGEKCEFFKQEVTFLGYVITPNGMQMDKSKVEAVEKWEYPTSIKELQRFLGFANFYRRFIKNYAKESAKLYEFLKKESKHVDGTKLIWTPEHRLCFDKFKKCFTTAPVLKHFDPDLPTIIECDSSDTVTAGILSQLHPDPEYKLKNVLHPVAYYSKKLNGAQINYSIGDKELLAIVNSFKH
jgi:hypothetical protein